MAIKRLNYFDKQFLVVDDFKDEQKYQRDMRQRLTRGLHIFGIAEGLEVLKTGGRQVTVQPGVAIDRNGQEIVLEASHPGRVLDLTTFLPDSTVHVTVAYAEKPDPLTDTRTTEEPKLEAKITPPPTDGTVVRLAQFDLAPDVPGSLNDPLDGAVRQSAGAKLGPASVAESNLTPALQAKVNTPQGLVSLDGVSNPGGNIDLVSGGTVTIASDDVGKRITIGETHSARTDNPHGTTAAQIGALLASQYLLDKRRLAAFTFTQADASGATRTVGFPVGFRPRLMVAISACAATLGPRRYGGGSTGFFLSQSDPQADEQRCFSFGLTLLPGVVPPPHTHLHQHAHGIAGPPGGTGPAVPPITDVANPPIPPYAPDWFSRTEIQAGVCAALFYQSGVQAERLVVTMTAQPAGATATLSRSTLDGLAALTDFSLIVNLFCMGV